MNYAKVLINKYVKRLEEENNKFKIVYFVWYLNARNIMLKLNLSSSHSLGLEPITDLEVTVSLSQSVTRLFAEQRRLHQVC